MLVAIGPVFAAICLGYILRRFHFPSDNFWPGAERITYYLLFPSLLINKLARADFSDSAALELGLIATASALIVSVVLILLRTRLPFTEHEFGSVFQGSLRMNTYIGLAGAAALYGDIGVTYSAVAIVAMIPLNNFFCVPIVAKSGNGQNSHGSALVLELAKNPFIIACGIGFALNALQLPLPEGFYETLAVIGRAALPLGLLAVGAGLKLGSVHQRISPIAFTTVIKLFAFPLLTLVLCKLFTLPPTASAVAVLFTSLPTSPAAYILAKQLRSDHQLMASIITAQTILSLVTIPVMLWLAG